MRIKVGIVGYGNLGRGVEEAVLSQPDMTLVGVFSRRQGIVTSSGTEVYPLKEAENFREKIDVMILCSGSAKDLPEQSPRLSRCFAIVDSYDDHENAQKHRKACHQDSHAAIVCTGWDPGLFSLQRVLCKSLFPSLEPQTFWGPGVSQGHSDALRQVEGVLDGRQYTMPAEDAIRRARAGQPVSKEEAHRRLCFVVAGPEADREKIRRDIQSMPHYFAPYETRVQFVSPEDLSGELPHGGRVLGGAGQMELTLSLPSNPRFTARVLTCCARAAYRLEQEKSFGAKTLLDVPLSYLCPVCPTEYL